jgi:hypothetical protein
MLKKAIALCLMLVMLSISLPFALAEDATSTPADTQVCTQDYVPVCGTDNQTYSNECQANAAGVDASYDGECKDVTIAANQEEETEDIHFVGMLIEIGSTDVPTTIIVRKNGTSTDYTVNIDSDTLMGQKRGQYTNLSDWIPGDQIRVIGTENKNTNEIDAVIVVNHSINITANRGINGWITNIDKDNNQITYQWNNVEHTFKYDDNTRFVAALKNPATVDDLEVNDRIRGRLVVHECITTPCDPLAKIVVVLRRGTDLFMKIRTFVPKATLVRLDSTVVPTTIQVKIRPTPGLRANDVNNLIGTEGTLVTVNVTEDTKIVRKFFGRTTLDEFSTGDKLHIVGRVNDDGTVDAKMIKNESIWKTNTKGHAGTVLAIDVANNNITVNWTPVKHQPLFKLKNILEEEDASDEVSAQTTATPITSKIRKHLLREGLKRRIKKVTDKKVGKFLRRVKHKKVKINRIKHPKVKLKKLITRYQPKKIRVDITDDTKIIIGTNETATINDIQIGDKVRIRGTRHAKLPLVVADTIVVVNSLPEIEEPEDTILDDINEVVEVITTDDEEVGATEEEEEIDVEETSSDSNSDNSDSSDTSSDGSTATNE